MATTTRRLLLQRNVVAMSSPIEGVSNADHHVDPASAQLAFDQRWPVGLHFLMVPGDIVEMIKDLFDTISFMLKAFVSWLIGKK
jgi:hypothetical protein